MNVDPVSPGGITIWRGNIVFYENTPTLFTRPGLQARPSHDLHLIILHEGKGEGEGECEDEGDDERY